MDANADSTSSPPSSDSDDALTLTTLKGSAWATIVLGMAYFLLTGIFLLFSIVYSAGDNHSLGDWLGYLWIFVLLGFVSALLIRGMGSWRLDAHGASWAPRWGKGRFIAWADVERLSLHGGVMLRSASASIFIPPIALKRSKKNIFEFLEARLSSRFDFSILHAPKPPVIRHPVFFTTYSLLAVLWYLVALPFISARVSFQGVPHPLFLAFILAPALPLLPFIIRTACREARDRYLPRIS